MDFFQSCINISLWLAYELIRFLSSPLAGKRDIVVTILVRCMCVRLCIRASVRICPDHNLYNNAWILKQFGTVVVLVEEKCHLKHFLDRLKVKVTGVK